MTTMSVSTTSLTCKKTKTLCTISLNTTSSRTSIQPVSRTRMLIQSSRPRQRHRLRRRRRRRAHQRASRIRMRGTISRRVPSQRGNSLPERARWRSRSHRPPRPETLHLFPRSRHPLRKLRPCLQSVTPLQPPPPLHQTRLLPRPVLRRQMFPRQGPRPIR